MSQTESGVPRRIISLDEAVIQQIAAGEVIQRPVNAIKELLDNALDAGSSQVNIVVKEGGKKLLSIQDNGHGIEKDDLPLLCKRHATSKLRSFEDLNNLSTLGFRGEALASISSVSHLSVITKPYSAVAGLRINYKNTVMEPPGPMPCAAQNGTTFVVDDLFYNNEQRRKALGSGAEEYARILDLLGRYAISRPDIGFSCKKQGERRPDLHTVAGTSAQDNVRVVYGASVAQSMLPIKLEKPGEETATASSADCFSFSASGFVSCTHYSGRKGIFIIRINGHIVQCKALEHSLEAVYFSYARNKPFVYLDIIIPGDQVDVNVHPTKHEVVFLHQDEILACITDAVESLLQGPVRCHCMRSVAHSVPRASAGGAAVRNPSDKGAVRVTEMIRTDVQSQKLQTFFEAATQDAGGSSAAAAVALSSLPRKRRMTMHPVHGFTAAGAETVAISGEQQGTAMQSEASEETGVLLELQRDIVKDGDEGLKQRLQSSAYVGLVDNSRLLVQQETNLLLVNIGTLGHDLFYQLALKNWGALPELVIDEPLRIAELAVIALQMLQPNLMEEERWHIALGIEERLVGHRQFLAQGAGIYLDEDSRSLTRLPIILDKCKPDPNRLPLFVYRLSECSDWESEKEAISWTAQALAELYSTQKISEVLHLWKQGHDGHTATPVRAPCYDCREHNCEVGTVGMMLQPEHLFKISLCHQAVNPSAGDLLDRVRFGPSTDLQSWESEHVLFPAIRSKLIPQAERGKDGSIVNLVSLKTLYKVFERC